MATGKGRGRGKVVRGGADHPGYFNLTRGPAVLKAPASLLPPKDLGDQWNDEDENGAGKVTKPTGLDYVNEHVIAEREKVQMLKQTLASGGHGGGGDGRERMGRQREWMRGKGKNTPADDKSSVYGEFPTEEEEKEVYMKYNFSRRVYDTSGLAINKMKDKLLSEIKSQQVVTIEGFTGCGKTTQVPQFILDDAVMNDQPCRIVVTQPRRIAAISVSNRVASERDWRVGGIIGYQVGMDKRISEDTRLYYMTTGVLLQLLIARKSLDEWTHIIIDEVHERDLETDLLLLVIKKLMVDTCNSRVRIIMMSATLNADKFASYYPSWCGSDSVNVRVEVETTYPIQEVYLEEAIARVGVDHFELPDEPKVAQECVELTAKIIENLDNVEIHDARRNNAEVIRGAVLVFLPGLLEIETMLKLLTELSGSGTKEDQKWTILPLHSTITTDEQQRVFLPARKGTRKIILATNIAESSITVPDIRYVIDFCLTKNLSCDPGTNYTCLRLDWASKNECIQRRGRCGRVAPGEVYRLITRKFYCNLDQEATPEMLRSSLESVILQVKLLDMGSPKAILALAVDPPEESNIKRAACNLKEIGAMTLLANGRYDAYDGDLTFVGRVLSRLPIDIRLGRLILLGHAFGCLEEVLIIAAGLSVKTPFACPMSKRLDAYSAKLYWSFSSFSDCMALINLYTSWLARHQDGTFVNYTVERKWAKMYFVQINSLREMRVLMDEVVRRLGKVGIRATPSHFQSSEEHHLILKTVIAGAFYPNYFVRHRPVLKDYMKEINRDVVGKDPLISVILHGFPVEQPADLYKKEISKYLQFKTCVPHVDVLGSKVVVSFTSHGCVSGKISQAVYRAIKLRQFRECLTFPIPARDEAYQLLAMRRASIEDTTIVLAPNPERRPGLQERRIQFITTQVASPSEFYVVLKKNEVKLAQISEDLKTTLNTYCVLPRNKIHFGMYCVASVGGKLLRGRIDGARDDDEVLVTMIDRGMNNWMKRNLILVPTQKSLVAGLHLIPAMALQCRLSGIQAPSRNDCVWTNEAIHEFAKFFFEGKKFMLQIYGIAYGIVSGTVYNEQGETSESVNDKLVRLGFAEVADAEPEPFVLNNLARERARREVAPTLSSSYARDEDRQNEHVSHEILLEPPSIPPDHEHQLITLRGPHSPLEMNFISLCGTSHMKHVVTDGCSVNSVVLDQEPYTPTSRLMVAASVGIAQRSGNIMARDTTLLPPIPGLSGILTMIFCPKMELRLDDDGTTYTSCVSGLGTVPATGEPVFAEHDMEIIFDTKFSGSELNEINLIRVGMSEILTEHLAYDKVRRIRSKIRKSVLGLLSPKRQITEEVWPTETHKWIGYPESALTAPMPEDEGRVFPTHRRPLLQGESGVEQNFSSLLV